MATHRGDIRIVIGDLNAKVGNDNTNLQSVMGRQGLGNECNDNGSRLIDLCASHRFFIGGTKFKHKNVHKYTWQSPDGVTRNQIDHMLISKRFLGSLEDVRTFRGADVYSDHQLLVGILRLRPAAIHQKRRSARRFNTQRLQDPTVSEEFALQLENCLEHTSSWPETEAAIKQTAEETLGFAQHQRKPWIREATWRQIEARRRLKPQTNQSRPLAKAEKEAYNHAERQVKRMSKSDKKHYFNGLAAEAEDAAHRGNMRGVYAAIEKLSGSKTRSAPPLKNESGTALTTEQQQLDRWQEFFESSNPVGNEVFVPFTREERRNPRREITTSPPNTLEIATAIGKLKNNKSPGPDNLAAELLKCNAQALARALLPIIREAWMTRRIPDSWKTGVIITIPKKGDLSECKNWRGITLLNTIEKVMALLILDRISPIVEKQLRREQAGFRPNRSCVEHINTLRQIIEQSTEMNSELFLLFVDFERAFDTVVRPAIWSALQKLGIPDEITDLIRELYRGAACKVRFKGKESGNFTIERGVRQGCVLSPILFLAVLDDVMAQTNKDAPNGINWRLNIEKLHDLDYADDICLFTHKFSHMEQKLQALTTNAARVGLKINTRKTKLMRVKSDNQSSLTVDGETIEDVVEFSYLGSIIATDGGTDADVKSRINKARHAYYSLNKVWRSSHISKRLKLRIFNTSVKSVLLYGSETWKVTTTVTKKLQVFINKCLRRILKIFWPNTISNFDLLARARERPIDIEIRRRKWQWIGHILRQPHDSIARMALEWDPQGSRNRGRPRETWRRSMLREAGRTGQVWRQLKQTAQDRVAWRELVSALCP